MSATKKAALLLKWKRDVYTRATEIDPSAELHWFALCIGWALGKGCTPEDAADFGRYVRYETEFG